MKMIAVKQDSMKITIEKVEEDTEMIGSSLTTTTIGAEVENTVDHNLQESYLQAI